MPLSLQITEATLDDWKELKGLCIITIIMMATSCKDINLD
jgi:hypothetical protein